MAYSLIICILYHMSIFFRRRKHVLRVLPLKWAEDLGDRPVAGSLGCQVIPYSFFSWTFGYLQAAQGACISQGSHQEREGYALSNLPGSAHMAMQTDDPSTALFRCKAHFEGEKTSIQQALCPYESPSSNREVSHTQSPPAHRGLLHIP